MSDGESSLFDELGGEQALRGVVERFVDRMFEDLMIGFLFSRASRARVKEKEYEFAAQHLGAAVQYSGRPLEAAHRPHRIFDGQFDRRLTILRETLDAFGVSERVRSHWLTHTESQRKKITLGACNEPSESERHS